MCKTLVLCFLFVSLITHSQNELSERILSSTFLKEKPNKTKTVKFIEPSKDKKRITYNPLTYLGGAFLFFYQTLVSEQIQANCAYHLSCSHFTKISMQTKGAVLGFFIGLNQLSCCFGGVADDHELCAITFEGKVDNRPLNE